MSSKKQFDHIEEKIKEAADNYQPAFDAAAWKAMEAKLDGDKKKRRPIFWWFVLPLILVGALGIYYLVDKNEGANKKQIAADKISDKNNSTANKTGAEEKRTEHDSTLPSATIIESKNSKVNRYDQVIDENNVRNVNVVDVKNSTTKTAIISTQKKNRIALHKRER
jgi:hypothetical protein